MRLSSAVQMRSQASHEAPEPQPPQDKRRQGLTAVPPHPPLGGDMSSAQVTLRLVCRVKTKSGRLVGKP